ncbi:MAG: hypothetical protein J6T39_01040 [Clostridia bacterium]|nr:hypothetical protein [Clostridia bacterium]
MQKLNISKSINIVCYDENDYISQNQKIYDDISKMLKSFDYDPILSETKDYVDNLNGDIFLTSKKINIFLLKQNSQTISFAIVENNEIKTVWTDFDFLKLGYATILLRGAVIIMKDMGKTKINCKIDENNLVAENLFDSFAKIDGAKSNREAKGEKIEYSFDFCDIDKNKLLSDIQKFAI